MKKKTAHRVRALQEAVERLLDHTVKMQEILKAHADQIATLQSSQAVITESQATVAHAMNITLSKQATSPACSDLTGYQ